MLKNASCSLLRTMKEEILASLTPLIWHMTRAITAESEGKNNFVFNFNFLFLRTAT
jgi:hypothetical protein